MRKKTLITTIATVTFSLVLTVSLFVGKMMIVQAEDVVKSYDVCVPSGLYGVTWNSNVATAVQSSMIDEAALQSGYVAFPAGTSEADMAKYKISVTKKTGSCYVDDNDGGKIKTCPTNDEINSFQSKTIVEREKEDDKYRYKYITMSLSPITTDPNSARLQIRIQDIYNGKAKIRIIKEGELPNSNNERSNDSMTFLRKENGYFIIDNVQPSGVLNNGQISTISVGLEIYLNDSSSPCNNSYVAKVDLVVDSLGDVVVANPAITDPGSYGCDKVDSYIRNMVGKGIYYDSSKPANELIASLKKAYSPMCFVNTTISYNDLVNLKDQITEDLGTLQALFPESYATENEAYSPVDSSKGLYCDDTGQNKYSEQYRLVASYNGTYWGASCQERYEVDYDHAKLVYAGGGFTYNATFKAIRECTIHQKAKVVKKPQCYRDCRVECHFLTTTVVMNHAGPNENFDSCVQTCDGGKYSQQCINSCYSSVYGEKSSRDLSSLNEKLNRDGRSFLNNIQKTSILEEIGGINDPNSSYVGWSEKDKTSVYHWEKDIPGCGLMETDISSGCDEAGAKCYVVDSVGPAGCSWNPDADYQADLQKSVSELKAAISLTNQDQNQGKYKIQIADSYLEKNGVAYVYEVDTNSDIVSSTDPETSCPGGMVRSTLGNSGSSFAEYCKKSTKETTVNVRLTEAYLNKKNGTAVYKKNGNYYAYNLKGGATTLQRTSFTASAFYAKEYKYYTNLLSRNVNVVIPEDYDKKVTLVSDETYWNNKKKQATITVNVSNFGTGGAFSKQINCYYGVYNNLLIQDDDPTFFAYGPGGNGDGDCPECGNDGLDYSGITFIYRTIELTDAFPNDRNPRWNWTNDAAVSYDPSDRIYNLLNYKVDPVALNEDIEDKGYSVYSNPQELDYDIILTPQQILNIRKYNKNVKDFNEDGSKNYLDYDMSCANIRGRDVCTSNFLDDSNYVSYGSNYNKEKRKQISVCNNAKGAGSTCDD